MKSGTTADGHTCLYYHTKKRENITDVVTGYKQPQQTNY
jgi:hypothetical protein